MKAVLFPGDRQVAVVERPTPQPGPGQALVQVRASAICRSDMSLYYGKPIVGGEAAAARSCRATSRGRGRRGR